MKDRTLQGFGKRLAEIRQSRPMTQAELGAAVNVSKRVIAYYEQQDAQPPGAMLVDLARALHVSTDELLGLKPVKEKRSPKTARLLKRLQNVEVPRTGQHSVDRIRREAKRGLRRVLCADYNALPDAGKTEFNHYASGLGVLGWMTGSKQMKRLEAKVAEHQGRLPLMKTLEAFKDA